MPLSPLIPAYFLPMLSLWEVNLVLFGLVLVPDLA